MRCQPEATADKLSLGGEKDKLERHQGYRESKAPLSQTDGCKPTKAPEVRSHQPQRRPVFGDDNDLCIRKGKGEVEKGKRRIV